jgi:hypothetical protein
MLSSQVVAALRVAAAPDDLLRTGSSPMDGIAFVAAARTSTGGARNAARGTSTAGC